MLVAPPADIKPWEGVAATGPILRPKEAAEYLGLSLSRYYDKVSFGELPKPIKMGARASGIPRPWLDAVIANRAEASR